MSRIAIIPGDGIGPEITAEAVKVLKAVQERAGLDLQMIHFDYAVQNYRKTGQILPDELIEEFGRDFDAIFIGALGDSRSGELVHAGAILRKLIIELDLYVHYRPVRLLNERCCLLKEKKPEDVNFCVFSDNSEGITTALGGVFKKATADEVAFKQFLNTRRGVERIIRHAFEYARIHGLKRVVLSSQGNLLFCEDDLPERVFLEVRSEYPEIESGLMGVNAVLVQMLKTPERFDVLVSNNLYSDAIADLGAQLTGGLSLAACAELHPGKVSLFMPPHNSNANRTGQKIANPLGAVASAALLLGHLGLDQEANWVDGAVKYALDTNNTTHDLGGRLETQQVGDFLAQQIRKGTC